jgi:hypothetical protein
MTTLLDIHQRIAQNVFTEMKPMDGLVGTVVTVAPLTISIRDDMPPLPASSLWLTEAVVGRHIDLSHTHTLNGHTHTGSVSPDTTNTDSGTLSGHPVSASPTPLYGQGSAYQSSGVINPPLAIGDKVALLRIVGGQQFIVLSRIVPAS